MPIAPDSRLIHLLATRSTRVGQFTLASGRSSTIYIDARLTTMSPDGMALVGSMGFSAVLERFPDTQAIGGLTMGADPIAYAISFASAGTEHPLRAFTVRKEPKAHGTGKVVEGPFCTGDSVTIIEDVITTGGSALRAAQSVELAGGKIAGILALVDRQEGGSEALALAGYHVHALTTAEQLLHHRAQLDTVGPS